MNTVYSTMFFLTCFASLHAQTNYVEQPNAGYVRYMLHPGTNTANLSYDYSDKWDIDGDGKTDSVCFIGNGGAHAYFFLRVVLSSDSKRRDFRSVQLDMLYIGNEDLYSTSEEYGHHQFLPGDFDNDGVTDIFLNFDNAFSKLPKEWKKQGIKAKRVVMSFSKGKLKLSNP